MQNNNSIPAPSRYLGVRVINVPGKSGCPAIFQHLDNQLDKTLANNNRFHGALIKCHLNINNKTSSTIQQETYIGSLPCTKYIGKE